MPKQYTVQAPDGRTITIEGPEGASEAEVIAQARQLYQPQARRPTHPAPVTVAPSMFEQATAPIRKGLDVVGSLASGALKGLAETAQGKGVPTTMGTLKMPNVSPEATTPQGTAEAVGKGTERLLEFMAPGAVTGPAKAALAAKTGSALLKGAAGATMEGVAAGAVNSAQENSTENFGRTAVTGAALSALLPSVLKGLGKVGVKIENVLVKPTKADIVDGFKPENVFKYGVGGTLEQTLTKTQKKLDDLTAIATQMRSAGGPVNVKDALAEAAVELQKSAPRNQGLNQKIVAALKHELDELDILVSTGDLQQGGVGAIDKAHQILQSVGQRGAWVYGARDAEAAASEKVANAFYTALRKRIEEAVPNGTALKEVNRAMMDLIPIKHAIIRRIPVEARNQAFHLSDIVTLSTGNAGLAVLNRALRSGTVAKGAVKASEMDPSKAARIGTGIVAGAGR